MTGPVELRATHRPSGRMARFGLDQPFALIGRSPLAAIRLDDPTVDRCHAYIQVLGGRPFLLDVSTSTGVDWDDGSRGRGWLSAGHAVQIGDFELHKTSPDVSAVLGPEAPPAWVVFEARAGSNSPAVHRLADGPVTLIGRHPGCDLRFFDDAFSYFHCALVNTPDGLWCLDLLTSKGTKVNGRRVELERLVEGDLLEFGAVALTVGAGGGDLPVTSAVAEGSLRLASPVMPYAQFLEAQALAPLRDMMEQMQQCFKAMAELITSVQEEQADTVREHVRQMRELMQEFRNLQSTPPNGGGAPAVQDLSRGAGPPGAPAIRKPQVAGGDQAASLTEAHSWFLERLSRLRQGPPGQTPKE